jgi:DNA invertase Pin-like site-specific DNA recombinase
MTMTQAKPKAYSYLRFSTPDQMNGDSFRRQTDLARKYALEHGLDLDESTTYHDLGVSGYRGRNLETGRLGDFLEVVRAGIIAPGSFLLIENLDRMSRQTARKAVRVLEDICDAGISVVTISDGKVYSTDMLDNDGFGLLYALIGFMRANDESKMKGRRLSASWENKRAQASNKPMTSTCPAWLRLDKEAGTFQVIEERAAIVRRVYSETLAGKGQNNIAETLNREGVPLFGRGKHWHKSYVAKLLESQGVIGTVVPHKMEHADGKRRRVPQAPVPDYYPAVVDGELYNAVQTMRRNSRTALRGRHAAGILTNVLGGLASCPLCGSTMTRANKSSAAKSGKPFLICTKAKAGAGCRYKSVGYQIVEDALVEHAGFIVGTCPHDNVEGRRLEMELESIGNLRSDLAGQMENLIQAIREGGPKALSRELAVVEQELDTLLEHQREVEAQLQLLSTPMLNRRLIGLELALEQKPLDRLAANLLLRQLLKTVVVDFTLGQLRFLWTHGGESHVVYGWPEEVISLPRTA